MKLYLKSDVSGNIYIEEHNNQNSIKFLMDRGWKELVTELPKEEEEENSSDEESHESFISIIEKEEVETILTIAKEQPKARVRRGARK